MDSTDGLLVKRFEGFDSAKHNATIDFVRAGQIIEGPGVLLDRTPLGTTVTFDGRRGGGFVSPIFRATLTRAGAETLISFERGLVGGVEPKIGDRKISDLQRGKRPALKIGKADFDADGVARIYVALKIASDWSIESAEIVASAKKLGDAPWRAHDLLGFVESTTGGSARYVRFAFLNHGHVAVQRQANGIARHLFFAAA